MQPKAMDQASWRRKDTSPPSSTPYQRPGTKAAHPPDDKLTRSWRIRQGQEPTSDPAPTHGAGLSHNWRERPAKPLLTSPSLNSLGWPKGNLAEAPVPGQIIYFKERPSQSSTFNDCFATGGLGDGHPEGHPLVVLEVHGEFIFVAAVTAHSSNAVPAHGSDKWTRRPSPQRRGAAELSSRNTTPELSAGSSSSSRSVSPRTPPGTGSSSPPTKVWAASSSPQTTCGSHFTQRAWSSVWARRYNPIGDAPHTDDTVARLELCDSERWKGQPPRKSTVNNQSPFVIEWAACRPSVKPQRATSDSGESTPQPRLTEASWRVLRDTVLVKDRFVGDSSEHHERLLRDWLAKEWPQMLTGQGKYGPP